MFLISLQFQNLCHFSVKLCVFIIALIFILSIHFQQNDNLYNDINIRVQLIQQDQIPLYPFDKTGPLIPFTGSNKTLMLLKPHNCILVFQTPNRNGFICITDD